MNTTPPPTDVAKSFMEHLRSVHFALLAACLALFAATLPEPPADLRLAKRDLERIQGAVASGSLTRIVNRAFLLGAYGGQFRSREVGTYALRMRYRDAQDAGRTVVVGARQRFSSLPLEEVAIPVVRHDDRFQRTCGAQIIAAQPSTSDFKLNLTPQSSLADVATLWDCLQELRAVRIIAVEAAGARPEKLSEAMARRFPSNLLGVEPVSGPWSQIGTSVEQGTVPALVLDFVDGDVVVRYDPSVAPGPSIFGVVPGKYVVPNRSDDVFTIPAVIPVSMRASTLPAQRLIAEEFFPGVSPGLFARRFPQLAAWSVGKATRNPAVLLEDISAEIERASDTFEIMGVKIPLSLVAKLGILVLIGLEGYFALHLRRFRYVVSPNPGGLDFPWLGVYPDAASRVVFATVTVGLPVAVTALLLVKSRQQLSGATWVSLAAFFGTVQTLVAVELVKFWRRSAHGEPSMNASVDDIDPS